VHRDVPPYAMVVGNRAKIVGLNLVGLKRAGFTDSSLHGLKRAYELLFLSDLKLKEAMDRVRQEIPETPEIQDLLQFIETSERGCCRQMSENIGLIAGKGQFPRLFAQAARDHGARVIAVAHHYETDPALADLVDEIHWIYVGQLGKMIRIFKAAGVQRAVMAGGITRGRLFRDFRPDFRALSVVRRAGAGKDDRLLQAVAAELESEGITIAPSTLFLDELLALAGKLGRRSPTKDELQDIDFGLNIAKEIGRLDIGQCVVVRRQIVVALEAIEGTDECIRRAGSLAGPGTVVVKVSKPNQDLRFDVPAVGPDTIRTMAEAKSSVLAIEAHKTLTFDRPQMLSAANQAKIAVWGV
jgi:UDP-2,3-diacylglucosamine hydrolase